MREVLLNFGVALGIGLLVGFQRERTKGEIGGVRTFPLIALTGALCGTLSLRLSVGAIVAVGLLALVALVMVGSIVESRREGGGAGLTTEVAALVVFLLGALASIGELPLAVVLGGVVALLLHAKRPLHGIAQRMSDSEVRALMRMVVIALVILPILPDATYDPYEVLNPFRIWLMVVLIVGISGASFVLDRLVDARTSTLLGGVLGGLISSTATTASYSRQASDAPRFAPTAATVLMIASTVVFGRIFVEVAAVAPKLLAEIAAPLGTMAIANVGLCAIGLARVGGRSEKMTSSDDPTGIRAALVFGALYGVVLYAVAAAKAHFGTAGLYIVAGVSGLTDVDAITLSVANLAEAGRLDPPTTWRAILIATQTNLVFKGALAWGMGGTRLLVALAPLFASSFAIGLLILWLWP